MKNVLRWKESSSKIIQITSCNFGHPTPQGMAKKLPKSKVDLWCRLVSYLFNTSSVMMSSGT